MTQAHEQDGRTFWLTTVETQEVPVFSGPEDLTTRFYPIVDAALLMIVRKKREAGMLPEVSKVEIEGGSFLEVERTLSWRDMSDIRRNIQAHITERDHRVVLIFYAHAWIDHILNEDRSGERKSRFVSDIIPLEDVTSDNLLEGLEKKFDTVSSWGLEDLTELSPLMPVPKGWEHAEIDEF